MKKLLSILLILCLAISFVACSNDKPKSSDDDGDEPKKESKAKDDDEENEDDVTSGTEDVADIPFNASDIIGTWKANVDLSDAMNEYMFGPFKSKVPQISGFVVDMTFTFRESGTLTMSVSEDSLKSAFENMKPSFTVATKALPEVMLNENMTMEDFLALYDCESVEAWVESQYITVQSSSIQHKEKTVTYTIEGNKLYRYHNESDNLDKTQYDVFKFQGNKFTLTEANITTNDSSITSIDPFLISNALPIVFVKQ